MYYAIGIILFIIATAYKAILEISSYNSMKNKIPENVSDIYDMNEYEKWKSYKKDVSKATTIFMGVDFLVMSLVIFSPLLPYIHNSLNLSPYIKSIVILLIYMVPSTIVSFIEGYVMNLKIDEKYGLNNQKLKGFIIDQVKALIISLVLFIGLTLLFQWLHFLLSDYIIIVFAIILFLLIMLVSFLFPVLSKIFEKFEPLEEGELRNKLISLLESHGYKVREIKVMKASLKTERVNAYFSGFGKMKTIVLYDTLLNSLKEDEILAVFAHEMGHGLNKDTIKNQLQSLIMVIILSAVLFLNVKFPEIVQCFGYNDLNYGFAIILLLNVELAFISPLFSIIGAYRSRKAEYKADKQAVIEGYGEALISGLKVLSKKNMSNLAPNRLNVILEYDHPTTSDRISYIEEELSKKR